MKDMTGLILGDNLMSFARTIANIKACAEVSYPSLHISRNWLLRS